MKTFIDEKAPKTRDYVKYIFSEIKKQSPLNKGDTIEFHVIEKITPFPKITEIPDNFPDKELMSKELRNWEVRHPARFNSVFDYTNKILESMCTSLTPVLQPSVWLDILFNFVVINPEKLRSRATGSVEKLFLNKAGDLWHEPKDKYCYPMMESKERLNIVKYLAKHQTANYIKTKILASELGKNTKYIRSDIGKINTIARNNLRIEKIKLIDSKQGSGYRLNPAIKIKILTR